MSAPEEGQSANLRQNPAIALSHRTRKLRWLPRVLTGGKYRDAKFQLLAVRGLRTRGQPTLESAGIFSSPAWAARRASSGWVAADRAPVMEARRVSWSTGTRMQ